MKYQVHTYDSIIGWQWIGKASFDNLREAVRLYRTQIKDNNDVNVIIVNRRLQIIRLHGTVPTLPS